MRVCKIFTVYVGPISGVGEKAGGEKMSGASTSIFKSYEGYVS